MRQFAQFAALFLATALVGSAQQLSGGWELDIRHDPMDDSENASMLLKAKTSTRTTLLPTLVLRCQSSKATKEPDVYLITETPLTVENGHHTHALRIRFDDNAPEVTVWSDSQDDKAVFHDPLYFDGKWHLDDENPDENPSSKKDAPNCEQFTHDAYVRCVREKMDALMRAHDEKMAKLNQRFEAERNHADPAKIKAQLAFINRIAAAKRLRVEFTPFGETPVVAEFEPTGATPLLTKMGNVCGWPTPP